MGFRANQESKRLAQDAIKNFDAAEAAEKAGNYARAQELADVAKRQEEASYKVVGEEPPKR